MSRTGQLDVLLRGQSNFPGDEGRDLQRNPMSDRDRAIPLIRTKKFGQSDLAYRLTVGNIPSKILNEHGTVLVNNRFNTRSRALR